MNELRHQKDTALKLRIPLSQQDVPAVMAVLGKEGVVEGKDYRGAEVLSVLKHIPDSPWYMVAKIDTSEALSAWRFRAGMIIAFFAGLLAAALAGIGLIWQRRQRLAYQALYQAELESQALRSHFEYLVKYANDIIILVDENQHIVEVNDRALESYGYTRQEMLGMPLTAIIPPRDLPAYEARLHKIQQKGTIVVEAIHQRKDGSTFPVEASGRTIKIEDKPYLQEIIRDITKRKRSEEALKHLNLTLRAIRNVNQLISHEKDRNRLLEGVCRCLTKSRGYQGVWVALLDESSKLVTHAQVGFGSSFLSVVEQLKQGILPPCGQQAMGQSEVVVISEQRSTCGGCPLSGEPDGKGALTVRLEHNNKVYGLLSAVMPPDFMTAAEIGLFQELANDCAFALYDIDLQDKQKAAEESLRRSERNFRDSMENSPLGIRIVTADGETVYANRALLDIYGYSSVEELKATPTRKRYTPESYAEHQERKEKRRHGEFVPSSYEIGIVCKNGEVRHLAVSRGEVQWNGKRQFQVAYQDITERKRAENELREFKIISDKAGYGITIVDLEGNINYVNTSFAEMHGYTPDELIGRHLSIFHNEQQMAHVNRLVEQLNREGSYVAEEVWHRKKDNTEFPTLMSGTLVKDENGTPLFMAGTAIDITERERAEDALRQSEERYRTILKEIADSYFEVDLAGNLTFVNDATCHNLRYSREELLGMNYRDFTAKEDIEHVYQAFNEVYRTGKPNKGFLWKVTRKDGSAGFADASVYLLRSQGGEIIGFRGVGRDITEHKLAEEERIQLELKAQITSRLASVGEMAAGVAHEINNPLTAVTGYAQLLVGREDIPSDIRSDLEAINDGARRVAGIVRTLLAFSRQTKPQRKLVDINELIESTLVLRAYHLRVNNIEVVTRLATDMLETVVDPGQIQQVLLNLIVNAEAEMKLAHGKGKLTITTEKSDKTIKICVKDNGPGIKPEVMDKIFDPFFTTREVGEGTGLGLSLCYGIVTEHKGKIYAESKPGKGATFVVELPVVTEVAPPKPAEPLVKTSQKAGKARILVVDDEQVIRDVVNRVLTGEGYKVETVDNATDALKKIESQRYKLILVDIKMPGMDGVELYKRIQKIARSLARRVVFITGDIMGADTEKFLSETKVAYIDKPFDAEQLSREVRRALTGGR
ncbi:MAG: hypothetical protein A2Z75_07370 [Chloroflexi bacterium RBG_13_50_10]|nr:MAG: hypothetical protein A2Z75_07370 [Chloroflexi bacterium RBG_13_50_10]